MGAQTYIHTYIHTHQDMTHTCTHTHTQNIPAPPFQRCGSMQFQRSDSIVVVGSPSKPFFLGRSRLETEFEELEVLGSGGFGDVIKVSTTSSPDPWGLWGE